MFLKRFDHKTKVHSVQKREDDEEEDEKDRDGNTSLTRIGLYEGITVTKVLSYKTALSQILSMLSS